jgi:VNT family MFS transporter (synaptic vesicle glycoprotein 2)
MTVPVPAILLMQPPLVLWYVLQVGVGRFQWMALLVCGLANAADAVEILGMSLVLPAAEGDPKFELTPSGKSALSSCIFLGMLLGGVLWGPMGDVLGQR